jgi:predicted GNAT family N-acyltransferase
MSYIAIPLTSAHKKADFICGKPLLDGYLHTQAKQDVKRRLSACFILADETNKVIGYYTLSSASIPRDQLPDAIKNKMPPRYHDLPATLLGRLATDLNSRGQGFGETLLLDALKRSYDISTKEIGSMAVIVDPIDEDAIRFYAKYGFILLPDSGKMFMAMETMAQLFSKK